MSTLADLLLCFMFLAWRRVVTANSQGSVCQHVWSELYQFSCQGLTHACIIGIPGVNVFLHPRYRQHHCRCHSSVPEQYWPIGLWIQGQSCIKVASELNWFLPKQHSCNSTHNAANPASFVLCYEIHLVRPVLIIFWTGWRFGKVSGVYPRPSSYIDLQINSITCPVMYPFDLLLCPFCIRCADGVIVGQKERRGGGPFIRKCSAPHDTDASSGFAMCTVETFRQTNVITAGV